MAAETCGNITEPPLQYDQLSVFGGVQREMWWLNWQHASIHKVLSNIQQWPNTESPKSLHQKASHDFGSEQLWCLRPKKKKSKRRVEKERMFVLFLNKVLTDVKRSGNPSYQNYKKKHKHTKRQKKNNTMLSFMCSHEGYLVFVYSGLEICLHPNIMSVNWDCLWCWKQNYI